MIPIAPRHRHICGVNFLFEFTNKFAMILVVEPPMTVDLYFSSVADTCLCPFLSSPWRRKEQLDGHRSLLTSCSGRHRPLHIHSQHHFLRSHVTGSTGFDVRTPNLHVSWMELACRTIFWPQNDQVFAVAWIFLYCHSDHIYPSRSLSFKIVNCVKLVHGSDKIPIRMSVPVIICTDFLQDIQGRTCCPDHVKVSHCGTGNVIVSVA